MPAQVERGSSVRVAVSVTNTGARAGAEVVQLYLRDVISSLPRPPKELKGFARVSWVAEPGEFEVLVGSSSRDIRATGRFLLKP